MNELFEVRNEHPCNLKQNSQFCRPLVKSVYHGSEILSYLGSKVWDVLPNIYKNIDGLQKFKKAIKKWKPDNCLYYYQFVYSRINNLKFKILHQSYKIYIKYNIIDKIK